MCFYKRESSQANTRIESGRVGEQLFTTGFNFVVFFCSLAPSIVSVPLCGCLSVHDILKKCVGEQFLQQANKIMNDSLFLGNLNARCL